MIYKFQPFSTTKNVGQEYNAHCAMVPNANDWILILDYDAMILSPKAYQVMETAIARYPETRVFGAKTNRVGLQYQRHLRDMDGNDSMRSHMITAEELATRFADGHATKAKYCAGFFMLFQKSYWQKHPFQEKIINKRGNLFDYEFTRHAGKLEGGVRIIHGVYCWHTYRLLNKDVRDKSHLK